MTFGELMDKMREIYGGNERDYNQFRTMAEAVLCPGDRILCDATTADAPPASHPPFRGKVFILAKIWFDRYGYEGSHMSAFASFKTANAAMCDDYRITWDAHKCQSDDADGFYTNQQMPGESDDCGDLQFRDESRVEWYIREAEVEYGEED
jgi:hypothetical protein